jgi:hypothetical protein
MDKSNTKIPLSELATIEQLLDQTPAHKATEVSKRRAIGILAPKLYGLRDKGYTWRTIAAWLTDHGLAVTVPALQRYLRSAQPSTANHGIGRQPDGSRSGLHRQAARSESRAPPVPSPASARRPHASEPSAAPLGPAGAARAPDPEARVSRPDSDPI